MDSIENGTRLCPLNGICGGSLLEVQGEDIFFAKNVIMRAAIVRLNNTHIIANGELIYDNSDLLLTSSIIFGESGVILLNSEVTVHTSEINADSLSLTSSILEVDLYSNITIGGCVDLEDTDIVVEIDDFVTTGNYTIIKSACLNGNYRSSVQGSNSCQEYEFSEKKGSLILSVFNQDSCDVNTYTTSTNYGKPYLAPHNNYTTILVVVVVVLIVVMVISVIMTQKSLRNKIMPYREEALKRVATRKSMRSSVVLNTEGDADMNLPEYN
eukprot:TRINITY_DN1090_c0_g1_i2.p1 TRINITY_DN1090_c0_g1~~TRINITY_DN1090_c0_g1_i2.p1  ORF type:complete len:269 (+),score=45.70 TRINITY_DN1090_c0_g1_i2:1248-2054(+)